jgi:integrase
MQWAEAQLNGMGDITKVGLFSGMRIGEICRLKVEDVHIEGDLMAFFIRKGKTNAAQLTVPVCNELVPIIKKRLSTLEPEALLFGVKGKKASRYFSRFKVAEITTDKTKRFHSFRVHMSTAFDRAGIRERTAAFIVGHKGGETMTYGYYAKADELHRLKDAIEKAATVIKRDWL